MNKLEWIGTLLGFTGFATFVGAALAFSPAYENDCVGTVIREGNVDAWAVCAVVALALLIAAAVLLFIGFSRSPKKREER